MGYLSWDSQFRCLAVLEVMSFDYWKRRHVELCCPVWRKRSYTFITDSRENRYTWSNSETSHRPLLTKSSYFDWNKHTLNQVSLLLLSSDIGKTHRPLRGQVEFGWTHSYHIVIKKIHIPKFVSQPVFFFLIQQLYTSGRLYAIGNFTPSTSEIHRKAEILWPFPAVHSGIYLVSAPELIWFLWALKFC